MRKDTHSDAVRADAQNGGIEVVLLDLGGVLIELGGMSDIVALAGEPDEDEIWRRWLACPWVRRFERGQCSEKEFGHGMVESWSMPATPEAFLSAFAAWPKGLLPGAHELVRSLSEQTRVACLSNTNKIHTDRHWSEFGLHDFFDGLYFSHEMGLIKPDRDCFDFVVDAIGCPKERILFLDDNQINVDGARAAGLRSERAVGVEETRAILKSAGIF